MEKLFLFVTGKKKGGGGKFHILTRYAFQVQHLENPGKKI